MESFVNTLWTTLYFDKYLTLVIDKLLVSGCKQRPSFNPLFLKCTCIAFRTVEVSPMRWKWNVYEKFILQPEKCKRSFDRRISTVIIHVRNSFLVCYGAYIRAMSHQCYYVSHHRHLDCLFINSFRFTTKKQQSSKFIRANAVLGTVAPKTRITWTNDGLVHQRIYTSSALNELKPRKHTT